LEVITEEDVKNKLKKYVISSTSHPHLPRSLDGEILLEERRDQSGTLIAIISSTIDNFLNLPVTEKGNDLRESRGKSRVEKKKDLEELTYETLIESDPDDVQGWKKYFDKWKAEGLI